MKYTIKSIKHNTYEESWEKEYVKTLYERILNEYPLLKNFNPVLEIADVKNIGSSVIKYTGIIYINIDLNMLPYLMRQLKKPIVIDEPVELEIGSPVENIILTILDGAY